jgi:outer membrane receptor protein involved in Fe transport
MVNSPVIDGTLGVRATAYYNREGGFIDNLLGKSDSNEYSTSGGRLKALWQPTDQLTVHASLIYQKLTSDGRPQMFAPGDPMVAAAAAPGESFAVTRDYQTVKFVPDPFDDHFTLANALAEYRLANGIQLAASTSYQNRQIHNQLDDTYRIRDKFGPVGADGVTPLKAAFVNDSNLNDFAQELRASQKLDSGLGWIAGVYYEHHNIHFVQSDITPGLDALALSYGLPPAAGFGAQMDSVFDGNEADIQQQFAGFGEVTIPLASHWDFIAGVRVFHYKQDSNLHYAGIANDGITGKDTSTSESGNTPKAQFTYRPTKDVTVYLQAAKGFRLGGITEPLPLSGVFGTDCAKDLTNVGLSTLPERFKSDHLWSFELGTKTSWFDNRLVANAALFDIEWSNIQTNVFLPCGFITVVNAGKVRSRGGEAEVSWAATRGLTLSAAAAYTNATLVDKTAQFSAQEGDRVPNVPKITANAAAEYRWPLGTGDRSIFTRAAIAYIGDSFTEFDSLVTAKQVPSSTSVDASLGVSAGKWEAAIFAKNLTNRFIVTGVDTDRNVPVTYSVAPPRTLGLEVRTQF